MKYKILENQYRPKGVTKTYYYIVNELGEIYHHSDGKFRKKSLMEITTYIYYSREEAQKGIEKLETQNASREKFKKIEGIKISREKIEGDKTRIRLEKDGLIMGIVYPTVIYPNEVSDAEAIKLFKAKQNKQMEKTNSNEIVIDAGDFKFTEFSEKAISGLSKEERTEDWAVKLIATDAKIHTHGMVDKITFSDDRIILIAYKVLVRTETFNNSKTVREWFTVKRYLDIYVKQDVVFIDELRELVNMHMGFTFTNAQPNDEQLERINEISNNLKGVIYEEGYVELPQFVLDVIEQKEEVVEKPKRSKELNFSKEKDQWQGALNVAKIMLEDTSEMTIEEVKMWRALLSEATDKLL